MNPVIPGDHPDCTLTQIGNDFYTTGSSFNVTPTIYHSTDLVHWEAIARPVRPDGPILEMLPAAVAGADKWFYTKESIGIIFQEQTQCIL